jgi:hypothetical protein
MAIETSLFDKVEEALEVAHLIAWDGCHKIYLAMDEVEATWFRDNYEITVEDTPEVMLSTVIRWFDESCFLRFVSAVYNNPANPNDGFIHLIDQFEAEEDEDEDEDDE